MYSINVSYIAFMSQTFQITQILLLLELRFTGFFFPFL